MNTLRLNEEQKEFYDELAEKIGDSVESIEMVCFEAEPTLFDTLGLKPLPGRNVLWGILVYGKNGLYLYVNPVETTILGFKISGGRKPPKEQLFSFDSFLSWDIQPVVKKTLFGLKNEKYTLILDISYNSEKYGVIKGRFTLQTQLYAKDTLLKMSSYKK